jgi:hypothetical protein
VYREKEEGYLRSTGGALETLSDSMHTPAVKWFGFEFVISDHASMKRNSSSKIMHLGGGNAETVTLISSGKGKNKTRISVVENN